ncbi:NAD(+) salvage pathway protein [Trifolium repens]|nr:NAD(+) salvage pathway protein [Trifolium repens]
MILPITKVNFFLLFCFIGTISAQLSPDFYDRTCHHLLHTIKSEIVLAVHHDARMGASLLRLHFHDCFVQGCDASVLLDDTSSFTGEKSAFPNANSLRGFDVIDRIKSKVEKLCPNTVSCADILAVAARDSVVALDGPSWSVPLGRRDSTTASLNSANSDLPAPFSDLSALTNAFSNKGFTVSEMVALSGGNLNLSPLDTTTPNKFDNAYFKNLQNLKGLLHSDQVLFDGSTNAQVNFYANSHSSLFRTDFANAMFKMANLSPLTGSSGQIRKFCGRVN